MVEKVNAAWQLARAKACIATMSLQSHFGSWRSDEISTHQEQRLSAQLGMRGVCHATQLHFPRA